MTSSAVSCIRHSRKTVAAATATSRTNTPVTSPPPPRASPSNGETDGTAALDANACRQQLPIVFPLTLPAAPDARSDSGTDVPQRSQKLTSSSSIARGLQSPSSDPIQGN